MASHHPPRHCFDSVDFTDAPLVIVGYFTEGQVYEYNFTGFPVQLAGFITTPTGAYFNSNVRNAGIPFHRVS